MREASLGASPLQPANKTRLNEAIFPGHFSRPWIAASAMESHVLSELAEYKRVQRNMYKDIVSRVESKFTRKLTLDRFWIRIQLDSLRVQQFPFSDVADLYNLYLTLEEMQESAKNLGERERKELLRYVSDLQRTLCEHPARASAIVCEIRELFQKFDACRLREQDVHQTSLTRVAISFSESSQLSEGGKGGRGEACGFRDGTVNEVTSGEGLRWSKESAEPLSSWSESSTSSHQGFANRVTNSIVNSLTQSFRHSHSVDYDQGPSDVPSGNDKIRSDDVSKKRYVDVVGQICVALQNLLDAKEQDIVGFGLEDLLGLRSRRTTKSGQDAHESQSAGGLERLHQQVYYATNRNNTGCDEQLGELYGTEFNKELHFGISKVSCVDGKPQVLRESQHVAVMEMDKFKASLREEIEKDEKNSVILYVHGCFSDFGRAMGYGAQIAKGLDFKGPVCVYSWPTVGRPSLRVGLGIIDLYRKDEESSHRSASQLRDVLQVLSREVGAKNIHIVAYSMGARTLLEALTLLGPEDLAPETGVTSHMYFMAPDATANFFSQVAREFKFPKPKVRKEAEIVGEIEKGAGGVKKQGSGESRDTIRRRFVDDVIAEPREIMDFSEGCTMRGDGTSSLRGETVFTMLEQLADLSSNIVGDTVSAIRTAGQVWREGRKQGWVEALKAVFGPDTSEERIHQSEARPNAHLHLYAAQNDIALVLSELMDRGTPQIRAGRRTKEFLLCNDTFDTIDASALKQGLLTTGHFYLFHKIVRADMRHLVDGRTDIPWWRQLAQWRRFRYFKLRHMETGPSSLSSLSQKTIAEASREACTAPQVTTSPLIWSSP